MRLLALCLLCVLFTPVFSGDSRLLEVFLSGFKIPPLFYNFLLRSYSFSAFPPSISLKARTFKSQARYDYILVVVIPRGVMHWIFPESGLRGEANMQKKRKKRKEDRQQVSGSASSLPHR